MRLLRLTLAAAAALMGVASPATAYSPARVLFTFADDRITESSGLVASSTSDRWIFTHNDSGDQARFYVVDTTNGRTLARHTMPGVDSNDWEDIARGPDERGRSSLWLGDIGDNAMMRSEVVVYRVPEPSVDTTRSLVDVTTPAPAAFRLRYEDVPHDAEAMLVHPRTGQLFIVTKTYVGASSLYAAPQPLHTDGVNVLTRVADLLFTTTGTPGGSGFGPGANLAVTGGDISPSGSRLALRTYTDLYEWPLPDTDVAAAVQPLKERTRTPLPSTVQGEAVGYTRDGRSVLVSTEGKNAPVHLLAGPTPAAMVAPTPPPSSGSQPTTSKGQDSGRSLAATGLPTGAAVAALLALVAAGLLVRRSPLSESNRRPPHYK